MSSASHRLLAHRHALRAASAVTGRARVVAHAALCCALVTSPVACSSAADITEDSDTNTYYGEPDTGWVLQEDASSMPVSTQDMSSLIEARADMGHDEDMAQADMMETDMVVEVDASADMAQADMMEADMTTTRADCVGEDGLTDWRCCVAQDLDAAGCDFCENRFPSEEDVQGCLTCGLFRPEDAMCCSEVTATMQELGISNDLDPLGCAPWGPPAPPRYQARITLRDFTPRPIPSRFRREGARHAVA